MAIVASVEFGEHAFGIDETTNSTLIS